MPPRWMNLPILLVWSSFAGCTCGTPPHSAAPADPTAVATVAGEPIRQVEVDARRAQKAAFARDVTQAEIVHELIGARLLAQEARRRGLEDSTSVKLAVQDVLASALVEDELRMLPPLGEEELRAAFSRRAAEFKREEAVRLAHILFGAGADSSSRTAARSAAVELKTSLESLPDRELREVFTREARERSADEKTRHHGGDLGFATRAALEKDWSPDVAELAFQLRRPGVLAIAESPSGVHLIRYTGRVAGIDTSFAEVEGRLRHEAELDRRGDVRERLRRDLEARAEVRMGTKYAPQAAAIRDADEEESP